MITSRNFVDTSNKTPVFFINLFHAGPYTGVLGAQVRSIVLISQLYREREHCSDLRLRLRGVRHGQHLVHHPALRREALGHLLGLQGQDGEGGVILSMFLQTLYCFCSSLPQMKMSVIKTITGMFWAVSIVLATLPLLGYGRYVYEVSRAAAPVYGDH